MAQICNICCEPTSKSKRRLLVCQQCQFEACKQCIQTYILENPLSAHCMNCKVEYEDEYIISNISRSFFNNEIKEKQKTIFIELEKALIPNTLEYARERKQKEVILSEIKKNSISIKELEQIIIVVVNDYIKKELNKFSHLFPYNTHVYEKILKPNNYYSNLYMIRYALKKLMDYITVCLDKGNGGLIYISVYNKVENLYNFNIREIVELTICNEYDSLKEKNITLKSQLLTPKKEEEKSKEKKYTIKCQDKDCNGYVCNRTYKCGLCDKYTCSKCFVIKEENHICNENDIKSAELIKKETKPCPNCSERIFKIEGCDQMWCTECNTAFSWKTGNKINHNSIHNPHYFEYLAKQNNGIQPRNRLDVLCGGIPDTLILFQPIKYLIRMKQIHKSEVNYYKIMNRNIGEMQRFLIHLQFHLFDGENEDYVKDLRADYIMKTINEDSWKKRLLMYKNKVKKNKKINDLLRLIIDVGGDLLRNYDSLFDTTKNNDWNTTETILPFDKKMILDQYDILFKSYMGVICYVNNLFIEYEKVIKKKIKFLHFSNNIINDRNFIMINEKEVEKILIEKEEQKCIDPIYLYIN